MTIFQEFFFSVNDSINEQDSSVSSSSDEASAVISRKKKEMQKGRKKVVTSKSPHSKESSSRNPSETRVKSSTSVNEKKCSVETEPVRPSTSRMQPNDVPKNDTTSKLILGTIKRQAAKPNSTLKENVENGSGLKTNAQIQKSLTDAPPDLQDIVKNFPTDTALIFLAVKKLTIHVTTISNELKELRNSIERSLKTKMDQISIISFMEIYDFQKLSTVADIQAFDVRLNDEEYVKNWKVALVCLLDSDIQRTITGLVKQNFHRELAMQCTAFRKSKDKFILKGTRFYDVLFDFVTRFHKGPAGRIVTEKEFYQTLSSCLTNAKDWEGNRKNRIPAPVMGQAEALLEIMPEVVANN